MTLSEKRRALNLVSALALAAKPELDSALDSFTPGRQRRTQDTSYGEMICFCGHTRDEHGPSNELGADLFRADACLKCGAKVCDEFQWDQLAVLREGN